MQERNAKEISNALQHAANMYREAAENALHDGSAYDVYMLMKEYISLINKVARFNRLNNIN